MKIKLTKIQSAHNKTQEAINHIFDELRLNNTSVTLYNSEDGEIIRTSSIEKITIQTKNSLYTLERIDETGGENNDNQ